MKSLHYLAKNDLFIPPTHLFVLFQARRSTVQPSINNFSIVLLEDAGGKKMIET